MGWRRRTTGIIGVAVVLASVARGLTRRFTIREASMAPALAPGDWVVARRRTGRIGRGDIVVFPDPTGSGMSLVKRVIGLEGEMLGVRGGRVMLDGALLADRWAHGDSGPDCDWRVDEGEVWLLGDNRGQSVSDGRVLGPTDIDEIEWIVVARYWPRGRIGFVR